MTNKKTMREKDFFPYFYRKDSIIASLIRDKISNEEIENIARESQSIFIKNHKYEYDNFKEKLSIKNMKEELIGVLDRFNKEYDK